MFKIRKILFYAGLALLIVAAAIVGGYHFFINHYAGEIDSLMDILLAETAEEEAAPEGPGPQGPEAEAENPENADGPHGHGGNNGAAPGTGADIETPPKDPAGHTPAPDSGITTELENKYGPAFKNIDLKDQLFTVQMLRKFSAAELQEMYRLYSGGGKSRSELLSRLKAKITPDELQRIKEVFQKNKDLL